MKKLLLVTDNFPPRQGGIANVCLNIAKSYPVSDIVVLAPKNIRAAEWDNEELNLDIIDSQYPFTVKRYLYMGMHNNSLLTLFSLILLYITVVKELYVLKPDYILIGKTWPISLLVIPLKLFRKPIFIYVHTPEFITFQSRLKIFLSKISLASATAIIANSHWTERLLLKAGIKPEYINVVNPKVDISEITTSVETSIKILEKLKGRFVVLTLGRIYHLKGQETIINHLPNLCYEIPNLLYVICGDGPDKEKLKKVANKLGVSDFVLFVEYKDAKEYLCNCDVFLLSSMDMGVASETFGIVALEASCCMKPVLASSTGGIPDAVEDMVSGVLYDQNDGVDFFCKLKMLADNEDFRKELGQKGYERVCNKFTHLNYYTELNLIFENNFSKKKD